MIDHCPKSINTVPACVRKKASAVAIQIDSVLQSLALTFFPLIRKLGCQSEDIELEFTIHELNANAVQITFQTRLHHQACIHRLF
ncbi:hypothetical protein XspCFBP7912_21325 [Xanthomonas sp. CFBP 7912]|nr:hypothetical protein XspCFBP7912_21325 [Xanthomonas sp. CFBP 7912]RJS01664.1 hypothetical protein XnspCFBP7698_21035 [Xanthomonas sp. CFBP 7698]